MLFNQAMLPKQSRIKVCDAMFFRIPIINLSQLGVSFLVTKDVTWK